MSPQHLLALSLLCLSCFYSAVCLAIDNHDGEESAPQFWWDFAEDGSSCISHVIQPPLTSEIIDSHTFQSKEIDWKLNWAVGSSIQWLAGSYGFWTVWNWNSTKNKDIDGGGIVYNETGLKLSAGVSWLRNMRTGDVVWNCFVKGNVEGQIPWDDWRIQWDEDSNLAFVKEEGKWGFIRDGQRVVSKHCATGTPMVGKRYRHNNGREVETSVNNDPFQNTNRRKRSPNFFEKVSQTLKEWVEKVKNFFTGRTQEDSGDVEGKDGEKKCNTFLDIVVRIIDFIFGKRGKAPEDPPNIPEPPGGVPQGPNGEIPDGEEGGGDPPGGAEQPPADAEEVDVSQNEALRDWE